MTIKFKNGKEYHEQHVLIPVEMKKDMHEVINNFKSFKYSRGYKKVDPINNSELIKMLITEFLQEYHSNDDSNEKLMVKLDNFRKGDGSK